MQLRDKIIAGIALLQIPVGYFLLNRPPSLTSLPPPKRLTVTADILLDSNANKGYTLVEFGDYQCPPCAANEPAVEDFRQRHARDVAFRFRHFPLSEIHPLARRAAIDAEASRPSGRFDETHKSLYALHAKLNERSLADLEARYPVDASCRARVEGDERIARLAKVTATPTFMLCCPDGTV